MSGDKHAHCMQRRNVHTDHMNNCRNSATIPHRCRLNGGRSLLFGRVACLFLACILALGTISFGRADHAIVLVHYFTGPLAGGLGEMLDVYNAGHPEAPVVVQGMEHESFKSAIRGMLLKGHGSPTLFSYWAGERTQAMVAAGHLAPLDAVWKRAGLDSVYSPAVSRACTYGGKKYGVPVTQHVVEFFYNRAVFDKVGVRPPATWEGFLAVCERLKKEGIAPLALGNKEGWPAQFWFDFLLLRTAGPAYRARLMQGKAAYDDPEVVRVFSLWQELLDKGYFSPSIESADWAGAAAEVRSGRAAMTLMGTWIMGYYADTLHWREREDYDFFPFPAVDADVPQVAIGSIDTIVMTSRNALPGAEDMLAYFTRKDLQEVMSAGSGAIAPSLEVPLSFYSPMKRAIAVQLREAPEWCSGYDLSVPPPVAEVGLGLFEAFLRQERELKSLLGNVQRRVESLYN